MSIKKVIFGLTTVAMFSAAQAQVSPTNVPNQFDYAGPDVTSVEFSGPTTLVKSGVPLDCTLSLVGDLDTSGLPNISIIVKDGDVTGSFLCNLVDLGLDPSDSSTWWTATDTELALPNDADALDEVTGLTFTNLDISTPIGNCSGTVTPVSFANGTTDVTDASYFDFVSASISGGSCSVSGTLTGPTGSGDANIW
ncbi:MAG: hypothetical protein Q7Q73_06605 [Verrucomicrobiota bacterium JB024]|nr:hypothetical protein [Verrucomicrobiota bacterium JB024]